MVHVLVRFTLPDMHRLIAVFDALPRVGEVVRFSDRDYGTVILVEHRARPALDAGDEPFVELIVERQQSVMETVGVSVSDHPGEAGQ